MSDNEENVNDEQEQEQEDEEEYEGMVNSCMISDMYNIYLTR